MKQRFFPLFALVTLAAFVPSLAWAQEACVSNTGANAIYIFPVSVQTQFAGAALESNDVVTAHASDGRCVGRLVWQVGKGQAMAVWGDDIMTGEKDGMIAGEVITFRVRDVSRGMQYDGATVAYTEGGGTYVQDGINVVKSLTEPVPPLALQLRVFLQGPYDPATNVMRTSLRSKNLLPLSNPYAGPDLTGTPLALPRQVTLASGFFTSNPDVVDYVIVELRTSHEAASVVAKELALLLKDGRVAGLNGQVPLTLSGVAAGSYYVTVRHRNHLDVMSAAPVDLTSGSGQYDFTEAADRAYGALAMIELEKGVYGLYAGDANGNGQIQNSDKIAFWLGQRGKSGYLASDFNMDGAVGDQDRLLGWWPNQGRGSTVP